MKRIKYQVVITDKNSKSTLAEGEFTEAQIKKFTKLYQMWYQSVQVNYKKPA